MSNPSRRGPRALSDILGELFTVRGYGRLRARQELEDAWNKAVGEPYCCQTLLGEVRRGVLSVTVAHSALLEELSAFRKSGLLAALQAGAPATAIYDIRFRVGAIVRQIKPKSVTASSAALTPEEPGLSRFPVRSRRDRPGNTSKPGQGSDPDPAGS